MNRRPTLLAALTLTAAAALTLSACGGGDSSKAQGKDDDKVARATDGATSPSPPASTSAAPKRPQIDLPTDLTYTFDWPKTGAKDKDAVLADSEQSIKAVDLAIVNQDPLDKAYLYYYEGEAATGVKEFVQDYVDAKAGITGAYRFYHPEVAVDGDGTASLSYCEDQGKAYVKYLPDKVKKTEITSDSYVRYDTSLKKNGDGVWAVQKIDSQRGSAKCQP